MGSNDGAEISELSAVYILSKLSNLVPRVNSDLYQDDCLILLRKKNGQLMDRIRKNVIKLNLN